MDGLYETSGFMSFLKLVYIIIVFAIVLGISYYFSKFIGKRITNKTKYIKHIETLSLGSDKYLHIISVCEEFYLISSSNKGIYYLDKLSKDDLIKEFKYDDLNDSIDDLNNNYENMDIYNHKSSFENSIYKLKNIIKGNKKNE